MKTFKSYIVVGRGGHEYYSNGRDAASAACRERQHSEHSLEPRVCVVTLAGTRWDESAVTLRSTTLNVTPKHTLTAIRSWVSST